MLKIRQEQIDALEEAQQAQFDREVMSFLRTTFPERCVIVGEEVVRTTIAGGKADAAAHGITVKRDAARYIALMFAIGVDFRTKEPPRWVRRILGSGRPANESLDRLQNRIERSAGS